MTRDVTVGGAAAATGSAGALTIVLSAELQRRNVPVSSEELVALVALLSPTLHVLSRTISAVAAAVAKKWFGAAVSTES
jgi:hypothetical protein